MLPSIKKSDFNTNKYRGFFSFSLVIPVLYYCGYISSDFHNKILGIQIDYSPIDLLKWGGDFFFYTIIDNSLVVIITLGIVILFYRKLKKYFRRINERIYRFVYLMFIILSYLAIYCVLGRGGTIDYQWMIRMKEYLHLVYSFFFIINICSVIVICILPNNRINVILVSILFTYLPSIYGIYGRSYEYYRLIQYDEKRSTLYLTTYNEKVFLLGKEYNCSEDEIYVSDCKDVVYSYQITSIQEIKTEFFYKENYFTFIEDYYAN